MFPSVFHTQKSYGETCNQIYFCPILYVYKFVIDLKGKVLI
jgi:hypothetical protein